MFSDYTEQKEEHTQIDPCNLKKHPRGKFYVDYIWNLTQRSLPVVGKLTILKKRVKMIA